MMIARLAARHQSSSTDNYEDFFAIAAKDGGASTYDKWASSYDSMISSLNPVSCKSIGRKWRSYHANLAANFARTGKKHRIFDAGCGTGQAGETLLKGEFAPRHLVEIHGGDISTNMLEIARSKNLYTNLQVVDLYSELPYDANTFDSIVSNGVFLEGHCGPECLPNLIRVLKHGCYLFTAVRRSMYEEAASEWKNWIRDCDSKLVEDKEIPYHDNVKGVSIVIYKT